MGNVIAITGHRVFTLSEVNTLLPLIIHITDKYESAIEKLLSEQRYYVKSGAPKHIVDSLDYKVINLLNEWGAKVTKLGGKVLGTKAVSFDSGFGYWSWLYGEKEVSHYYDYSEQVNNRRKMGIIVNDKKGT